VKRRRRRASDIADVRPRRGLGAAFVLAIGLGLVVLYKVGVGEETAGFIAQVAGDPELELPPSVLDRLDSGPIDSEPPTNAESARGALPPDGGIDATRDHGADRGWPGRPDGAAAD